MNIKIENISKNFKNIKAVDDLSVEINDGELVTFLGPSGCGKSTTLFILAGLYTQDHGNIFFGNVKVNDLETEKRNIGMVFQNYALYPHMTVLKNILFPLEMQKIPKKDSLAKANELLELLKIRELQDRKPNQLSGGQQQRVAIARALIKSPQVLLMDEPLSNLDAKLRVETREEIKKLQQHLGITTIFVTHDQDEAASISDRILIMNNGKLQQFDKPRQIYNNPNNLFTAKFMGNTPINIFSLRKNLNGFSITDTSITLPEIPILRDLGEPEFLIGIRPEHFEICTVEDGILVGIVELVEMQGKDNLITFSIGNLKCRCFSSPKLSPKTNDKIGLKIKSESILAFNKNTGDKLSIKM
ncbi:MAG: ABC transporter ATP-binding protein [Gudongella sp.]|nr:ABC transporter ATP-binding protein [Gudongella sp.]